MDYAVKENAGVNPEKIKADLKRQQERLKEYADHYRLIGKMTNGGTKK
jgi:hypothetical protein